MTLKDSSGTPIDLSAAGDQSKEYKFAMQVRNSASDDGAVGLVASTIEGLPEGSPSYIPISDITGTNAGVISVVIHADDMKAFPSGRYVYDLQYRIPEGAPSGKDLTKTFIKGAFVVNEDVTEANALWNPNNAFGVFLTSEIETTNYP